MTLHHRVSSFLHSKKLFYVLLTTIFIVSAIELYLFADTFKGGDYYTYLYYTKGFQQHIFSYWYFLNDYIPDTFRNPGYPLFIYFLSSISSSIFLVYVVQFFCFLITLYLLLNIIDNYRPTENTAIKNILLLFLVLNSQIPLYINFVFPEILMLFLIVLLVYLDIVLSKKKISTYIILGLLYGIIFQIRPVILFFPFIKFALDLFYQKKDFSILKNSTIIVVFIASMLPYGYWNYKNNGIFSVTSIEGGGGVMHLGYWGFKMPNYLETRYWRNVVEQDLITFTPLEDAPKNIDAFNKEWDFIDSSCAQYLTEKDKRNLPLMKEHPELFVTYNAKYTYEREKLLKKLAIQHYLDDIGYTIKIKVYTAFRLWVTGIKRKTFNETNPIIIFKGIAPAIVTGFSLLMALIFIPLAMLKRKFNYRFLFPILVLVAYYGLIHVPFAIQARYTVPVRPILMMLTAICLFELYFKKGENV